MSQSPPIRFLSHHEVSRKSSTTQASSVSVGNQEKITPASVFARAEPALALVEFSSIAQGIVAADAMAKQSPIDLLHAGTVQPGRYLVLLGGQIADVEEALKAGKALVGDAVEDTVWLPGVHPSVLKAIHAAHEAPSQVERPEHANALGIIETRTAPSAIHAADVAVKGADIILLSIRLADGLGGKGLVLLSGSVSDVEASVALVKGAVDRVALLQGIVIPQLHEDIVASIFGITRFFRP